jgi:hypothetical protein
MPSRQQRQLQQLQLSSQHPSVGEQADSISVKGESLCHQDERDKHRQITFLLLSVFHLFIGGEI